VTRPQQLIATLGLQRHPERGYFVETYRAPLQLDGLAGHGGPLEVLLLAADGTSRVARLGGNLDAGERPQLVIPAETWFAAEVPAGVPYCLWGCTVAPGFDFADFELAQGPELAARYPRQAERIGRMLRPAR